MQSTRRPATTSFGTKSGRIGKECTCSENWQPLTREHGASLRLYLAVKYGYKSLKRIGLICFQDERPLDYWVARAYDWYAGPD
jgi:DMSO/TMAO reductase YedYZ molybdopterin-dependent catalytic subunit